MGFAALRHAVDRLAARPWPVLVTVAAADWLLFTTLRHATSWKFFEVAVRSLFVDDGVRVYERHGELQFGPLAIVVAAPIEALPTVMEKLAAMAFGQIAGLVIVAGLFALARSLDAGRAESPAGRRALLIGGIVFLVAWSRLSLRSAHIDDEVTLAAIVWALVAVARRQPRLLVALVALAAAVKPWGVVAAPLVAVLPGRRTVRLVTAGALVAATWAPFVLGAPDTVSSLGSFDAPVEPTSGIATLGFDDAVTPDWARPLQLAGGFALAALAVARRRWLAAPMVGIAVRLALDPATHYYYVVGLVVAVMAWELGRHADRIPWAAIAVLVALEATSGDDLGGVLGVARLATLVAVVLAGLLTDAACPPQRSRPTLGAVVPDGRRRSGGRRWGKVSPRA